MENSAAEEMNQSQACLITYSSGNSEFFNSISINVMIILAHTVYLSMREVSLS